MGVSRWSFLGKMAPSRICLDKDLFECEAWRSVIGLGNKTSHKAQFSSNTGGSLGSSNCGPGHIYTFQLVSHTTIYYYLQWPFLVQLIYFTVYYGQLPLIPNRPSSYNSSYVFNNAHYLISPPSFTD